MTINATFIGQIIVFPDPALVHLEVRVPPSLDVAIDARQKKIAEGLAAADRARRILDEAKARADAIVREARERANQIVDSASPAARTSSSRPRSRARCRGRPHGRRRARTKPRLETAPAREALRREVRRLWP
jgi:F-type H+-transporting ATPase subunit b